VDDFEHALPFDPQRGCLEPRGIKPRAPRAANEEMSLGVDRLTRALRFGRALAGELSGRHAQARARLDGSCAAILMYHRVLPRERAEDLAVEPGMFVTPETFARQLEWLGEQFRVLPLGEIAERIFAGAALPPRACAISFDDGWRDNAEFAAPALAARGLPATIFLVTRRVGTLGAFWPDELARRLAQLPECEAADVARALGAQPGPPLQALLAHWKALPDSAREDALDELRELTPRTALRDERELMDWSEVDALAKLGIEFESHGASHALLPQLPFAAAARELEESRAALRARGYARRGLLAYPNGAHDPSIRKLARESGYRAALTTARGLARPEHDRFELPRVGLHQDISGTRAEFLRVVPGRVE
jgi:peptidoglycan/xylan/chitin deacetylase (PgdA/CDA1 family)